MSASVIVTTKDGRSVSRGRVAAQAAALIDALDRVEARPALLPLCAGFGDFMAVVLAARRAGLAVVLPHDSQIAAVNRVIADSANVVVVASAGDDVSGIAGARAVVTIPPAPGDHETGEAAGASPTSEGAGISLFTSGTTGAPVRHTHSFQMLDAGAATWRDMLGAADGHLTLVSTVPPQHMYGLEASIMLPLSCDDVSVYDRRPFYAADIADALNRLPAGRVLVTTPMHLDMLLRDGIELPALHAIVSATTTLDADLAARAERSFDTRIVEVFGTTETGLIATREPARTEVFTPRADISLSFHDRRMTVKTRWRDDDVSIDDTIDPVDGGFRHAGRGDDLINVAGKRASLSGLTRALTGIAGVTDGMFVMPAHDASTRQPTRPVAFAVAPGLDAAYVRGELRERIAQAFVPRRVFMLDALPRTPSGKPHLKALLEMLRGPQATFAIPADHPALAGHFPGNPVVPGAIVLDRALCAAGAGPDWAVTAVKFNGVLRPDEACAVEKTEKDGRLDIVCRAGNRQVMSAKLSLRNPS